MLNVLTLNAANYDDHPGWLDRLGFIVDTILGNDNGSGKGPGVPADIVCLSEIRYTPSNTFYQYAETYWQLQGFTPPSPQTATMADMIVALLQHARPSDSSNYFTQFAMQYENPQSEEGLTIVSRFPLSDLGYFEMPGVNDQNKRITQYATASLPSGDSLTVYNTHFALDADDRMQNARLVIQTISQQNPSLFFLAGDFNATPTEPSIELLAESYTDTWTQLQPDDPGLTFAAPDMVKRIDYIFASQLLGKAAATIQLAPPFDSVDGRSKVGTVFASDHLGVFATFNV